MKILKKENFTEYLSDIEGFVVYDGSVSGNRIIVPNSLNLPDSCFSLIPKNLVPTKNYFNSHSEYDKGAIWDSVQNYGNQTDYSYAFSNWGASERIIPKYPLLNVDKCMYALKDCTGIVDARNLVFHITNEAPNMIYVCANCTSMVYAPRFIFYNANIVRNYTGLYTSCTQLKEAEVYWGDGTTDPIQQRNMCQNMFFNCKSLINVDFGGDKTGSPQYLDLSYAEYISYASIKSLAKSLQVIDNTEASQKGSVHEITLSETTKNLYSGTTTKLTSMGKVIPVSLNDPVSAGHTWYTADELRSEECSPEICTSVISNESYFQWETEASTYPTGSVSVTVYSPWGKQDFTVNLKGEQTSDSFVFNSSECVKGDNNVYVNEGIVVTVDLSGARASITANSGGGTLRLNLSQLNLKYKDCTSDFTAKGWTLKALNRTPQTTTE